MRWRWGRTAESLVVVAVFVAVLAVVVGPETLLADLRAVELGCTSRRSASRWCGCSPGV